MRFAYLFGMKTGFVLFFIFSCLLVKAQKPLLGRTTGLLPYLEYGVGDDRLGGAKMTCLDTNV
jgi:N-acetylmuramoyl-L-alanine amidase